MWFSLSKATEFVDGKHENQSTFKNQKVTNRLATPVEVRR
jgi:hypothetical protein